MAKYIISDRVVFAGKRSQARFLLGIKKESGLSWVDLAHKLKINPRTIRDWSKGKYNMSMNAASILSKEFKTSLPKISKIVSWKKHLKSIAKNGGLKNFEKNKGASLKNLKRQENWQKWWEVVGNHKSFLRRKKIKIPIKDHKLAEFVGIMIGDGGVAPYHISITLNSRRDFEYSKFVFNLLHELFEVRPKVYRNKKNLALNIILHGVNIVDFCQSIGLKKGNKLNQRLDVPGWVKRNGLFVKACLRGLFDTDGSIFVHRYSVKNKDYEYIKASFSSKSVDLIKSVWVMLKKYHFNARITKNHQEVRLETKKDLEMFRKIVGSNNPKHIKVLRRVAPNGKAAVC